ncbi:MAG: hypothetical protein KatS3mg105_1145 [Gemmatales bacterium]|nr:MAG: hypothetical protein KatS3mg105_1145 [Gemmatales bacterium]
MVRVPLRWPWVAVLLAGSALCSARANAQETKKGPVSFINDVAPIFKEACFACHDAKKRKGKFDMTTYESFRKGGDNEDPIVPGKPEESNLVFLIESDRADRMPPKKNGDKLAPEKIAIIKQWIKEGAKLDEGISPKADLLKELRRRWQPPPPPVAYKFPVTVTAIAFTPDNRKLVVGGQHELTVWNLADAKLEKRLHTRAERAYAIRFLHDGKIAVAGGRPGQEGDVRIYDLNGKAKTANGVAILDGVHDKSVLVEVLLEADDSVLCLDLSEDGKKLAAAGVDRLVHVWDISAGFGKVKLEQTIENHADWVFAVKFSPDGKKLLSASRDKTAKVWDLEKRESLFTFSGHQAPVYGVTIKPDGKIGVSAGEDRQLRFWTVASNGKQVRNAAGHGEPIFKVIRHPSQPLLATCSADKTVRIWNQDNGSSIRTLTGHTDWVYAIAFSGDGKYLASGSWNGEIKIWNVADGKIVKEFNASPGLQAAK